MEKRIRSYGKIYNMGHAAIVDLFKGTVVVEEKVDGSQFSFGVIDGELMCRSSGKAIIVDHPEKMFEAAVETVKQLEPLLHPGWVYRGEYLQKPKHNALAYDRVPTKHIILFDIDAGDQMYLSPEEKTAEAARIGLEHVPIITVAEIEDYSSFEALLETISILGGQNIEGVVVKNYERFGKDGKTMMGKYVSSKFREIHKKNWKVENPSGGDIKRAIANDFRTNARWNKAIQHLRERGELTDSPKDIGPLMKEVSLDLLEECKDEILEKLFKWAWRDIARAVTGGLPEWYKELLAKKQFGEETEKEAKDE